MLKEKEEKAGIEWERKKERVMGTQRKGKKGKRERKRRWTEMDSVIELYM